MYLELRTTPRAITKTLPNGVITEVCSKYDYIATICEAMQEFKAAVAFINTYLHTTNPDIASPTMPSVGNSILPWYVILIASLRWLSMWKEYSCSHRPEVQRYTF